MEHIHVSLGICGVYHWHITTPKQKIIIRFKSVSGREWSSEATSAQEINDDPVMKEQLEQELLKLMYPANEEYALWIEDGEGSVLGYESPSPPGMYQVNTNRVTTTKPDGSQIIWPGERCERFHLIDLGNSNSEHTKILAVHWPPAFFLNGNNRLVVQPLFSIDEKSIRIFVDNINKALASLGRRIEWHITAMKHPPYVRE